MKIGFIIYGSIDTVTGGYLYDKKLVDYLKSKNIIIKIFSQNRTNIFEILKNNFSKSMINEILEFSPDILLQDGLNFISLFYLNKKLKKLVKFPIISIVHFIPHKENHNFITQYFMKIIEYFYFKTIDGFIFNSLSTKQFVRSLTNNKAPYLIANPGKDSIKLDITKEQIIKKCYDKQLMIIFIGNVIYNKGLHILLEALSEIDSKLWKLSIVGNLGINLKYTKKISNIIDKFDLMKNITMLGLIDSESIAKELSMHHLLAVPSYYESYGTVYAEALGAGLPVIASKSGGGPEIINDSINGFLIKPGDVNNVKLSIEKLIADRELLLKMSLSSHMSYQNLSSWDETMEKIYHFLHYAKEGKNNI